MLRDFAEYLLTLARSSWGPAVLFLHAFLEACILPLGHELFLIPISLARPEWSLVFAFLSTVASVLGISLGYSVGRWGGRSLLHKIIKPSLFQIAEQQIQKYDVWAIAIACFTPFPDKVFGPIAGAMHLNYKRFAVVAFISRAARFYLVCILLFFYGESVKEFILNHLYTVMGAILAAVIAGAWLWSVVSKRLIQSAGK